MNNNTTTRFIRLNQVRPGVRVRDVKTKNPVNIGKIMEVTGDNKARLLHVLSRGGKIMVAEIIFGLVFKVQGVRNTAYVCPVDFGNGDRRGVIFRVENKTYNRLELLDSEPATTEQRIKLESLLLNLTKIGL